MKKRIISVLLLCCMALGLLPTTAFANNGGAKAIQLGTSGISGYDSTNSSYDYIHFGTWNNSTVKWRVLDTKTNMANAREGDGFFLLSEALLGTGEFGGVEFDYTTPYFNVWKGSRAQDWCNDFYSRSLSITEQKAVLATSKSDALYGMYYDASDNILDGDKVFFLSAEEAENAAYGFTDDNARIANYGDSAVGWWLRSPRRLKPDSAGTVNENGAVIGEWVGQTNAARPAFNLKSDSVLLVSAAVGGKGAADGMFKIPEYSGDEWKLTLLDDTRTFKVTETTAAGKPGGTVTLNFSGPRTGLNEYISAIIEGENGAAYYGRIMKPTATDRQLSFTLPHDLASGNYKLHVFSEQCNGDYQTDYASQFQTVALTVEEAATEQFALTPGGTYYFDLSGENIPGTVNDDLPDKSMHYVPFTYAGAVDAYKLTSEMATTEEYAQQNEYTHSLFVADYAVTHTASWNTLNNASLIFGKGYAAGGVDYMLRAPSVGSDGTGSGNSRRGTPQSNEWDRILDKNDGYIKNWSRGYSWGQDTSRASSSHRGIRWNGSAHNWISADTTYSVSDLRFHPVLEVLNPDTLGADGLKAVTLDLGGGKLGGSSDSIQIIVKNGESFTAPVSDGLTRPDGNTGSYFMWLGSDGELYAPGDNVSADVTRLTAQFALIEQFRLAPGGTYYFDLSAMGIPGTVNDALPDNTMHYVPFTYVGIVEAYNLKSAMETTEEYAQKNAYVHSMFVADYAVTHTISWKELYAKDLIFGKGYVAGGVDYTLRMPSAGSGDTGSGNSKRGTPQSNEWDRILDKNDGYIKNWSGMSSWGQDTSNIANGNRALRGHDSPRNWSSSDTTISIKDVGFRPVLEVLNFGTLDAYGLKAITLDLGGGKLGNSSEDIQIIVKNGESFTAPASDGLTRPDGDTGSSFMWLGSDGKLYEPGDNVSADVTRLTAQFDEQFTLTTGDTYWFDLSGVGIPGTANDALPDKTMHYVPFTYAGTVDAYKLMSEMVTTEEYAQKNEYAHSLFVADYAVTHTVGWDNLDGASLIFGKGYAAGSVDYMLRAPSTGSDGTGSGNSRRGTPQSNEWDRILDKDDGYIKNCGEVLSWGQDTASSLSANRARRGYNSARNWSDWNATWSRPVIGFRPVLEVLNPDTLGTDGLKAITLDLGGGKLGGSSEDIQIIVKNGESFTAPASDGLTRPDGNTGSYFMWRGSDSKLYAPGDNVPADVDKLTALFDDSGSHTVTITTDALPDGKVGETYSQTLAADGTAPITWSISGGALPDGLKLDENTGGISGEPTAEGTATFTVKAENSGGSDTKELSITITKDAPAEYTVTVTTEGSGTASASHAKAVAGTEITLTAMPDTGYRFREWQVESPAGLVITSDRFFMPDGNVEVKAVFEEDTPTTPTDPAKPGISVTGTYTYNGSEHTAAVTGYDSATMDISGNTGTDAGDYTVSVTSRTGRWADGSTEAVTAVWSISKATQEAPNGLAGVAPTTEGGSDGKITGVTDKMEYRMAGDGSYTACGGTEIENLSAGNYFVRYGEDQNHFASPDGEVTVGDGTPLADCAITFNAGGGSGSMESKTVKEGTNYILPACGFAAPTDQEFKAWEIGGTEYKVGDSYTVNGDTEIKALWKDSVIPPTTYTITISNDGNGSGTASPSAAVVGTEITLTATPNTGYRFKEWEIISGGVTITNNKFTMPDGNVEVKAIFEKDAPPAPTEYTVTVTSGGNGTASASHAKAVVGTEITLTVTPDTGYRFKEWEIISGGVAITNNKFTMPDGNVEVKAIFEKDAPPAPTEYTVTVTSGGNGTASASHAKAVVGTEITLTVTPDTGYRFKEWEIISGGVAITNNKFTMPDGNVEVKAIFEKDAPPAPTEYTVTVTSGGNGTASASHAKAVVGTEITLTATPNTGYRFKEWEVISGGVVITNNKFTMPDGNVEVRAIFAMISQQTAPDPVNENTGIPSQPENSGTASSANTDSGTNNGAGAAPASPFSTTPGTESAQGIKPGAENTRRTTPKDGILLREWQDIRDTTTITGDQPAADEEAEEGNNPFTDVSKDDWFYDDVMFVYENGLMEGISSTQFGPYETQTRGRMAEILWSMDGSPAPKAKNSFADVEDGARYADAIAWIAENDILSGYNKDSFGPGDPITWEQLAVMFYRYAQYKGYDISIKGSQDELKDMNSTMDDAGKAVLWAVSNGLIREESDVLSALQDPVSRAEIAAMLHRFIDKYKLVQGMTPNGQMGFIAPEEMNPPQTDRSRVPGWIGISLCAALTGGFVLFMLWLRRRRRVM